MKNIFRFLTGRVFFFNVFIACAICFGIVYYIIKYLDVYTLHGQTLTVPDLRGMTVREAETFLSGKPLRWYVADSVYYKKQKRGIILEQNPVPGEKVKHNRTLYLIVNVMNPRRVKMPDLVDMSLRQAIATLQAAGLRVGVLEYQPNLAVNAVIMQKMYNAEVKPGAMIEDGATVDLVLGSGLSEEEVALPSFAGLTLKETIELLKTNSLNEGALIFNESVKTAIDTMNARAYKQNPEPATSPSVRMGTSVDIWFGMQ